MVLRCTHFCSKASNTDSGMTQHPPTQRKGGEGCKVLGFVHFMSFQYLFLVPGHVQLVPAITAALWSSQLDKTRMHVHVSPAIDKPAVTWLKKTSATTEHISMTCQRGVAGSVIRSIQCIWIMGCGAWSSRNGTQNFTTVSPPPFFFFLPVWPGLIWGNQIKWHADTMTCWCHIHP